MSNKKMRAWLKIDEVFRWLKQLAKGTWSVDDRNWFSASYLGFSEDGEVPSNAQTEATPENLVDRTTRQDNLRFSYWRDDPDSPSFNPALRLYRAQTQIDEDRKQDGRSDATELTTIGLDLRNSMRFKLSSSLAQILSYGLEYHEDTASAERDGNPRSCAPDGSQQVVGAYLQDEILIGERLRLIPAVRTCSCRAITPARVTLREKLLLITRGCSRVRLFLFCHHQKESHNRVKQGSNEA